jgi:hypothetical protein
VTGVPLRSALRLMLKEYDLNFTIEEGAVVITTVDEAGSRLVTTVHDVSDLLKAGAGDADVVNIPPSSFDTEPLIETIRAVVAATTWGEVGGPGTIKGFNGMLVISQTELVHEEIEKLLCDLRKVQARRDQAPPRPEAKKPKNRPNSQALQLRIYRINESTGTATIGYMSTIPVVGSVEQPKGHGRVAVGDEVPDQQGGRLAPLAQFGGSGTAQPPAAATTLTGDVFRMVKELAETIPLVIEPASWQQAGGEGTISALPVGGDKTLGTLLIRQTPAVHAQITRLLMQLNAEGGLSPSMSGLGWF